MLRFIFIFAFLSIFVFVAIAFAQLMASMARIKAAETDPSLVSGKVISLLEGGYDTSPFTLGLAKCVDAHVHALQEG